MCRAISRLSLPARFLIEVRVAQGGRARTNRTARTVTRNGAWISNQGCRFGRAVARSGYAGGSGAGERSGEGDEVSAGREFHGTRQDEIYFRDGRRGFVARQGTRVGVARCAARST